MNGEWLLIASLMALALLLLIPVAYYTFRGAVLLNFSPLARFFMAQVALSLFYVEEHPTTKRSYRLHRLTLGEPRVVDAATKDGLSADDAVRLIAAVEADSEHPIARRRAARPR